MKLTITKTFDLYEITCGEFIKSGKMYGRFIEKDDMEPASISHNYSWIQARNPRKIIYILENETTDYKISNALSSS